MADVSIKNHLFSLDSNLLKNTPISVSYSGRRFTLIDQEDHPHLLKYHHLIGGVLDANISAEEKAVLLNTLRQLKKAGHEQEMSLLKKGIIKFRRLLGKDRLNILWQRAEIYTLYLKPPKTKEEIFQAFEKDFKTLYVDADARSRGLAVLDAFQQEKLPKIDPDQSAKIYLTLKYRKQWHAAWHTNEHPRILMAWKDLLYTKFKDDPQLTFEGISVSAGLAIAQSHTLQDLLYDCIDAYNHSLAFPFPLDSLPYPYIITEKDKKQFIKCLHYGLSGDLPPYLISKENVLRIFALADYFAVPWLIEESHTFILANFTPEDYKSAYFTVSAVLPRKRQAEIFAKEWHLPLSWHEWLLKQSFHKK